MRYNWVVGVEDVGLIQVSSMTLITTDPEEAGEALMKLGQCVDHEAVQWWVCVFSICGILGYWI